MEFRTSEDHERKRHFDRQEELNMVLEEGNVLMACHEMKIVCAFYANMWYQLKAGDSLCRPG